MVHHTQRYKCKIELVTSSNKVTLVSSYVCSNTNSPIIFAMIEIKAKFRMRICAIFTGLLLFLYDLKLTIDVCV